MSPMNQMMSICPISLMNPMIGLGAGVCKARRRSDAPACVVRDQRRPVLTSQPSSRRATPAFSM